MRIISPKFHLCPTLAIYLICEIRSANRLGVFFKCQWSSIKDAHVEADCNVDKIEPTSWRKHTVSTDNSWMINFMRASYKRQRQHQHQQQQNHHQQQQQQHCPHHYLDWMTNDGSHAKWEKSHDTHNITHIHKHTHTDREKYTHTCFARNGTSS